MTVLGLVLVAVAAAFHVFVFVLESVLWTRPSTMRTFGIATPADAVTTLPLALNQGFYNLFLAIVAAVGIVLVGTGLAGTGASAAGYALVIAAAGSMIGAALVLIVSNPRMARAALMQGGLPALGLIALGIGALA